MFDIFFLYNKEKNAEKNFEIIKKFFDWVRVIENAKSIANAHIIAAKLSKTSWFYTIDADNIFLEEGKEIIFRYDPYKRIKNINHFSVIVFNSCNFTNRCVYGWGAVKLWKKNHVIDFFPRKYIDFTTSFSMKKEDSVLSIHHYNFDPFNTWKSVFREYFKLKYSYEIKKTSVLEERIEMWKNCNEKFDYKKFYVDAIDFVDEIFSCKNYDQYKELLNNFEKLKEIFLSRTT
ncbi:MAG: hypothetical protein NZZ41_00100 [Candidatus Dojkabacteria bacterium]|nr:hypothetical protein [Candidatus Dojkabacteria bacterium]